MEKVITIALDYVVNLHRLHTCYKGRSIADCRHIGRGVAACSSLPPPHSQGLPHRGCHAADKPSIDRPLSDRFDFIIQSNVCEGEFQLVGGKETTGASRNALADVLLLSEMSPEKAKKTYQELGPWLNARNVGLVETKALGSLASGFRRS